MDNFEEKDRNPNKNDKSMGGQSGDRNRPGQQSEPGRKPGVPREGQGNPEGQGKPGSERSGGKGNEKDKLENDEESA